MRFDQTTFKLQVAACLTPSLGAEIRSYFAYTNAGTPWADLHSKAPRVAYVPSQPTYLCICMESKALGRQDSSVWLCGHCRAWRSSSSGECLKWRYWIAHAIWCRGAAGSRGIFRWTPAWTVIGQDSGAYLHPVACSTLTWIFGFICVVGTYSTVIFLWSPGSGAACTGYQYCLDPHLH